MKACHESIRDESESLSPNVILPNFLVIGSAKCATTSLYFYLNQHPDIFMAKKKECHFFCHQDIDASLYDEPYRPVDSLEAYQSLFAEAASAPVRGEASPMYLYYPQTAERIHDLIPDAKLVAVLRNPADRAFSAYVHAVRDGIEDLSFEDAIAAEPERMASGRFSATHAYHDFGLYYRKLKPYFDRFPRDQIRVYLYEEVSGNMQETLVDICDFLGVDSSFPFDTRPRLNVSGVPKRKWVHRLAQHAATEHWWVRLIKKPFPTSVWVRMVKSMQYSNYEKPDLSPDARKRVLATYADDVRELSQLLDRDLISFWGLS